MADPVLTPTAPVDPNVANALAAALASAIKGANGKPQAADRSHAPANITPTMMEGEVAHRQKTIREQLSQWMSMARNGGFNSFTEEVGSTFIVRMWSMVAHGEEMPKILSAGAADDRMKALMVEAANAKQKVEKLERELAKLKIKLKADKTDTPDEGDEG